LQSIEFVTILTGFIFAFIIILVSMNLLIESMNYASEKIILESKAMKCALIVNAFYSQNPETITEKIECVVFEGISTSSNENHSMNSIVLDKNIKTIIKEGKTIILVKGNEHYR
jgi:hypothetical protein